MVMFGGFSDASRYKYLEKFIIFVYGLLKHIWKMWVFFGALSPLRLAFFSSGFCLNAPLNMHIDYRRFYDNGKLKKEVIEKKLWGHYN